MPQEACSRTFLAALFVIPNLQITQMSMCSIMDKFWNIHAMEYYTPLTNK